MNELFDFVIEVLKQELSQKVQAPALIKEIEDYPQNLLIYASEIQKAIDLYNQSRESADLFGFPKALFQNASHLTSIWKQPLPDYSVLIDQLRSNQKLSQLVFTELRESTYFKEVFEISDSWNLIHNLLILFYRTSLLFLFPSLREGGAQISSSIEEMSSALALEGAQTHLFEATKHWINNWEKEEFSPQLVQELREKKLI